MNKYKNKLIINLPKSYIKRYIHNRNKETSNLKSCMVGEYIGSCLAPRVSCFSCIFFRRIDGASKEYNQWIQNVNFGDKYYGE